MHKRLSHFKHQTGFTIVELLVVIVVIGILASVILVAYSNISQRATTASLQSDLAQAKKQIENFYAVNGVYPTLNNCTNTQTTETCLKVSTGNTLTYIPNDTSTPTSYSLLGKNSSNNYTTSLDPLLNGLVGWYRMMGNANDSSGNGNNGSTINTPVLTLDKFNNGNSAYSFNGTNQYISLTQTSLPIYSELKPYSIAAWINTTASPSIYTIYAECNPGSNNPIFFLRANGNILELWLRSNNGITMIDGNANGQAANVLAHGVWKHVAAAIDPNYYGNGNGKFEIFVDGSSVKTGNFTQVAMGAPLVTSSIGAAIRASSFMYFYGAIFDVRLYSRAISASEVQSLYSATSRL